MHFIEDRFTGHSLDISLSVSSSVCCQKTWGQGISSATSYICNITIALAYDAVEVKAKHPLPGIHATSTRKQKHYIFCKFPIASSEKRIFGGKKDLRNANILKYHNYSSIDVWCIMSNRDRVRLLSDCSLILVAWHHSVCFVMTVHRRVTQKIVIGSILKLLCLQLQLNNNTYVVRNLVKICNSWCSLNLITVLIF